MSPAAPSSNAALPARGRLEGLDVARALLMLGGLLLHASLWHAPTPLFDAIGLVSHAFRMGCFFALSGFFAAITMSRRPPDAWLRRRLVQLGLPTLFGIGVICPTMALLIHNRPAAAGGAEPLPFDWYHLWFLIGLLLYTPMTWVADRIDRRRAWVQDLTARFGAPTRSAMPLLLGVGAIQLLLMLAAAMLVGALVPPAYIQTASQWRAVAGYAPLYLLGFAMARSDGLREAIVAGWRPAALVVALTVAVYVGWYGWGLGAAAPGQRLWLNGWVEAAAAAFCPPAAFALIFRAALAINRPPPLFCKLADASLTIYLVHLPIVVAITLLFSTVPWNPYVEFVLAAIGAGLLSYAIHVVAVRPFPAIRLIVNGRLPPTRTAPSSVNEPGHHVPVRAADLHLSS